MRYLNYLFVATLFTIFLISCGGDTPASVDNGDDPLPDEPSFEFDHERNPGDSAFDFLRDADFEELVIEIDYMPGFRPEDRSLDSLKVFLERRLNKQSIIIEEPGEIPAEGQSSYSANEIRNLERRHRDTFSSEGRIGAYFIIADGEFSQANVLGIAHFNTSMALFGPAIDNVSGGLGEPSKFVVETIVMRHEFGHILGLVNNGIEMVDDHHDVENGAHCTVEECLMNFSVRTSNFFENIFGGEIPVLEEFCRTDISNAGGK